MVQVVPTGSTPEPQLRTGRGEPLLLLHGALLTWESWIPALDDLAADHDLLALTLPGHHGGPDAARPATIVSLADHAERALDAAGWDTAHLAGNSLGGWLALELAARGRARTVTAIAPAGLWRTPDAADSLLRKFRTFGPLIGLDTDAPPARPSLIRSLLLPLLAHRPGTVPNHVAKAMAAAPANCTIVEEIAEDPDLPTGFTGLDTLTVPVTILLPEHDRVLPPHIYAPLAPTPTREIRHLPGVGHIPMLEAPALITAEIRATVTRAAAARTA
ncbi:alpha/beta fold hydrolase [Nocardia sp. 2]|uniref:Alpha/beta fold hydrolase n=1 Tax=Nocardia acididurans TaxID=2802282 RepID=A0ABS1LXG1_9NOCA|nr:alpha/beta hydrolase [Nocardia acididurans]MBL1073027.1 alpha/beta fold hydrolase [Nocardia acididurans]